MPTYFVAPIPLQTNNQNLGDYLLTHILPRYDLLDCGHNQNHIWAVLKNAYYINEQLGNPADLDLLTTAVIYHDVGIVGMRKIGQGNHEQIAAQAVQEDKNLRKFFSADEIAAIATACLQHRASFKGERASLLSKIVADADTVDAFNFERILAYIQERFGSSDPEDGLQNMYQHYLKKHGPQGYAKFDLDVAAAMVQDRQELLRNISQDYATFREYFLKNYDEWFPGIK